MAEDPQDELPPHIRIVLLVGFGSIEGSGSLRTLNKPAAAVEIERGSTAALAKGTESGTGETRISRQVEKRWNPAFVAFLVRRLSQCPITLWPSFRRLTLDPSCATLPATSVPKMKGYCIEKYGLSCIYARGSVS
jgi:hypothetical protein